VVAYDNRVKVEFLDVPADLIATHGAVSEPVGEAMARGIRARLGADVGVGITGVAGPTGGTPEKPVGTVVIAVAIGESAQVRTLRLVGDRPMVRLQAVNAALDLVRRALQ
jgi:nicotinamide-nucleotide amidase